MADDKALKPKSFRIDDETANKFKGIANAIGGNQQETLAKLIEAYEFQSGKAVLTEKKADIEQFEKYINALTRMYMGCLEDNQNITEIVRTEFEALLKSKDATIQDLQEKLTVAKQLKEESVTRAKTYSEENIRLNNVLDNKEKEYASHIENIQNMLSDKDNLNKALTDSCNELKRKVDSMEQEHEELSMVRIELPTVQSERDELAKTVASAEKTIKDLKQQSIDELNQQREQLQIVHDRALLEIDKKYQSQIQDLKDKKQSEVDKYQQKYFDLLEQIRKFPDVRGN